MQYFVIEKTFNYKVCSTFNAKFDETDRKTDKQIEGQIDR